MIAPPSWFSDDVSRETLERLDAYQALLRKWTVKINLIARSTVDNVAHRHIWDSAQIYRPFDGTWCDLGSGGGLPGVVVAIFAAADNPEAKVSLIESDQRKATFLRTCARELALPVSVHAQRVENALPQDASVVSARALADLDQLLGWAQPHLGHGGQCVFMKGAQWQQEVAAARENWRFSCEATPSMTHQEAAILTIRDIERV
ncbi:16S rRNA (guanine(527)-N(7))-methyltransferase RsmG [uncultured Tateyamaria sp.]|uniref:16S rRNA (guanine(527)-N(7))-methyltransferase RsmG n=1 Tax=uncultured Tateyamaria sp. TaxID=455651 RepID=UPI00262152BD|nr:16S rRNA (guanine(527)-N(7))-methyltransferase RsmG [uncultured Tateyamaria sp.]